MGERLDKFLASQGLGTRKEVGKLIRSGAVLVNGAPQRDPGAKVEPGADQVTAQGKEIRYQEFLTIMLNKPAGVLSATEDRRQNTVLDLLPEGLRRRAERYNRGVALAQDYARQGKLLIVAPDDTCGVRTLSRDRDALLRLYEKGLRDGQKIPAFLRP